MQDTMNAILLPKILDILLGVITIFGISFKWRMGNKNQLSVKELIKEIEEKDAEIENLKIHKHMWQLRYEHLANKQGDKTHLPTT